MSTRKRWSSEEDKVLLDILKNDSSNLQEGFRHAATILDRTEVAISSRWYNHLCMKPTSMCFFTASKNKASMNRKISHRSISIIKEVKIKQSWWKNFLNMFK